MGTNGFLNHCSGNDEIQIYGLWNAQLTRVFSPQFEVYLGGENLANQRQVNPVIGIDQPFGRNFDASLVYAPVFGRMIYAGLRFNLK